jgi:rare lipoprotein A
MTRWLLVLCLAVTQCAAVAVALPGWSDDHSRLAKTIVKLKFAQQVNEPQAQEPQAQEPQVQVPQVQVPQVQIPQVQIPEPPKLNGANVGCSAGKRVIAASYGQGQRTTSSGERFDPRGMTAAHRTLPFGTRLTVTNLKTGKSVIVVVNDRGPSARRIGIDLSIAAAKAIGLDGIAAVCIE